MTAYCGRSRPNSGALITIVVDRFGLDHFAGRQIPDLIARYELPWLSEKVEREN
jgi:hypothetical protein